MNTPLLPGEVADEGALPGEVTSVLGNQFLKIICILNSLLLFVFFCFLYFL